MALFTLADYERQAAQALAHRPWAWDYYQGGSDDEVTLRANRTAFEQLRLRPRVLWMSVPAICEQVYWVFLSACPS